MASWEVAGWDTPDGDWNDVESGDPAPEWSDLESSSQIVVAITDDNDDTYYYTLWSDSGWLPDELEAEIDDIESAYELAAG